MPRPADDLPAGLRPTRGNPWILPIAAIAAIVLVAGAGLSREGRRWWCPAGDPWPWSGGVRDAHTSQHLLDPYSLTHLLHGVVLYALLWAVGGRRSIRARLVAATALEAAWELVENSRWIIDRYRGATMALGYEGDSILNSAGDILSCVLGFALAARLSARASVALFLAIDVGLLLVYRDNLLLNVVMLVHPIEAVRRWQSGG